MTRQQTQSDDYLDKLVRFWSAQTAVEKIWMSLYTPQKEEMSEERLTPADRRRAIDQLLQFLPLVPDSALVLERYVKESCSRSS